MSTNSRQGISIFPSKKKYYKFLWKLFLICKKKINVYIYIFVYFIYFYVYIFLLLFLQQSGGLFAAKPAFGAATSAAPATGGLFGAKPQGTTASGFGGFGTGGFGAAAPAATGFGAAPAGGLFGATANTQNKTTGFGFGGTTAFGEFFLGTILLSFCYWHGY